MIYAEVNDPALQELESELKTTQDAKWYRRLKIIEQSSCGQTVPELAKFFDISQSTVRDYIHRYNSGGLPGLARQFSSGSPMKIPVNKAEWDELLHRSPCQFDRLNTAARNWTQELFVQYFEFYYSVFVTQSAISKHLRDLGFKWNRGKLKVTSPDPLYTVKRKRIETLKKRVF